MGTGISALNSPLMIEQQRFEPPPFFLIMATIGSVGVLLYIAASVVFAPAAEPMYHFGENGAVTALSSVSLSMSSALAAVVFYVRAKSWDQGALFWLCLTGACLFLALDEQLMLHERGGLVIETTSISGLVEDWDDLIVTVYGILALGVAALFAREILHCRTFALLFAVGFAFFAIHTAIDSFVPNAVAWKDVPEEGAKLLCVFAVLLALVGYVMAMLEKIVKASR